MNKAAWYSLAVLVLSLACWLFAGPDSSLKGLLQMTALGSGIVLLVSLAIGRRIKFDPMLPS